MRLVLLNKQSLEKVSEMPKAAHDCSRLKSNETTLAKTWPCAVWDLIRISGQKIFIITKTHNYSTRYVIVQDIVALKVCGLKISWCYASVLCFCTWGSGLNHSLVHRDDVMNANMMVSDERLNERDSLQSFLAYLFSLVENKCEDTDHCFNTSSSSFKSNVIY